jgi:hypothetical protein
MYELRIRKHSATHRMPFDPLRFCHSAVITEKERLRRIREAAYFRAELRGFQPGREAEDWSAAEWQVDAEIAAEYARLQPRSR